MVYLFVNHILCNIRFSNLILMLGYQIKLIRRCGLQRRLRESGEATVLRWFGYIDRLEGERLAKKDLSGYGEVDQGEGE